MSGRPIVFGMTGALGTPGGIAAANLTILHALGDISSARDVGLTILSLLESDKDRPPFLPAKAKYVACHGSRTGFAAQLLSHAARKPLFIFDLVGLARPLIP